MRVNGTLIMKDTAVPFIPGIIINSGKLLIRQVKTFENSRMDIAKAIVNGIGINMSEILYHYYKHDKKEVKDTID